MRTGDGPVLLTIEAWVEHFCDLGSVPDLEALQVALGRVGRTSAPALVVDLVGEGLLSDELLAGVLGGV